MGRVSLFSVWALFNLFVSLLSGLLMVVSCEDDGLSPGCYLEWPDWLCRTPLSRWGGRGSRWASRQGAWNLG